uniref:Uncharacterized protein n=1 Tax=Arundo donax TaxID=35708 RepID=A0A0A8YWD2_ARUDO
MGLSPIGGTLATGSSTHLKGKTFGLLGWFLAAASHSCLAASLTSG